MDDVSLGGTPDDTAAFSLAVINVVPTAPVDADAAADTVAEGAATGTTVGITAVSTDPNGPDVTYALTDDAGGAFAIDETTGVVTVADGSLLDGPDSLSITVEAADGTGEVATSELAIAITNLDPTATNDSGGGFTTTEDTAFVTANVLANDTDPAGANDRSP